MCCRMDNSLAVHLKSIEKLSQLTEDQKIYTIINLWV